jgi:hypothetical protein
MQVVLEELTNSGSTTMTNCGRCSFGQILELVRGSFRALQLQQPIPLHRRRDGEVSDLRTGVAELNLVHDALPSCSL